MRIQEPDEERNSRQYIVSPPGDCEASSFIAGPLYQEGHWQYFRGIGLVCILKLANGSIRAVANQMSQLASQRFDFLVDLLAATSSNVVGAIESAVEAPIASWFAHDLLAFGADVLSDCPIYLKSVVREWKFYQN